MISSPDLMAFTKEPEFRETTIDPLALPEEFSIPCYPGYGTPWSKLSLAKFKKDFILLAEFSEQVGPQPLLTIPHETKACGTFDLNHFSVRIMSVDYQTSLTCSGTNSAKLNFVEDSKVILGDSKEGAFSYVHHFTLYDLEARGFVRPFCLAYVSSDENKIIQQFQQLSSEFSKVSECLKTGNRKNFANELETKLRDLEYTRAVLLKEIENVRKSSDKYTSKREWTLNDGHTLKRDTEDGELKEKSLLIKEEVNVQEEAGLKVETQSCTLQLEQQLKDKINEYSTMPLDEKTEELINVEKYIHEYKSLLKQVSSYPIRKYRDREFSPYEPDDLLHSLEPDLDDCRRHDQLSTHVSDCNVIPYMNTPLYSPKLVNTSSCRRFDKRLKTLEELCDEYFHQQALQQMHFIEKTFRRDASHICANQLCQNLLLNLKSTNFLFEETCDSKDSAGLQPGKAVKQSSIHQGSFLLAPGILSEPVSLESYASCVETVPIKLGMCGSNQFVTFSRSLSGLFDDNPPPSSEDFTVQGETVDKREGSERNCGNSEDVEFISAVMKRSISSGDSIEVLGTEKSFRTHCSSTPSKTARAIPLPTYTTPAPESPKQARVPTKRTCSEDSIEVLSTTDSILPEDLRASYPCAIDEESPELEKDEKDLMSQNLKDKQFDCVDDDSQGCPTITLSPADPAMICPSEDECHASCTPLFLLEEPCRTVPDDLSDCFSFRSTTASTASDINPPCIHGDKRGCRRQRCGRVGRASLKFLRQFPSAAHAVFSLLSGRTLVVLGSEEATVRRLVTALSVYTPHSCRNRESIQPWISVPLQLTDLLNWKLVGFNRTCSSTPGLPHCVAHYSRYISILDADQKILQCPTYNGTLINHLVDPGSNIIRGSTYFMFAQSVLGKLAARAFLLTFSHTLQFSKNSCKNRRTVRYHELHRDDKKILLYLSELIKLHFTEVPPNVLRFSYTANSVFKL